MSAQQVSVKSGRVTTEGDDLYYEVRGEGEPLLMIAGGGGDAGVYTFVANTLANEFRVITYDRRGNARSTRNAPQNFEISQQSRDAVAVLKAVGESSAFIFGNSSGAVIALDMAATQPQAVRVAVVHEPPVPSLLPDKEKWRRYFASIYWMRFRFGFTLAMLRFALLLGLPMLRAAIKAGPEASNSQDRDDDYFVRNELLPVTNYEPDIARIHENRVKMIMAAGSWSLKKQKVYARTAPVLAEKLGCEMVTFPGHHGSFMDTPQEWSAVLRSVLHKAAG